MGILKSIVKPKSLTDCSLDLSVRGKINNLIWRYGLNAERVKKYSSSDSKIDASETLQAELVENGITICQSKEFFDGDAQPVLAEAFNYVKNIRESDKVQQDLKSGPVEGKLKDYIIHLVDFHETLDADNPLLRLALDEKLLSTVAGYLGMWPMLHSVGAWLNFSNEDDAKASQLWHRDPEDLKTVKVFIYLDEVGPKTGPFTYIARTQGFGEDCGKKPEHAHPRRIVDEEMKVIFPEDRWTECCGPEGTMIIADTVGYHRGGKVVEGQRVLVTFTYTSGVPQTKRNLVLKGSPQGALTPLQEAALKQ